MINRVYKGVPDSVRGRVWYILLEIEKIKAEQKGTYFVSNKFYFISNHCTMYIIKWVVIMTFTHVVRPYVHPTFQNLAKQV